MSTDEAAHLISLPVELADAEFTEMISVSIICRLCANQSDRLIGIYSEDGVSNDLAGKMNLYLPIKVTETDSLPLQCCWQCASTVLAWHDLVVTSVEADRRLRSYQFVTEKQLEEITSYGANENILTTTTDEAMVAADTISKHTIHYEPINSELLIEDNSMQIDKSTTIVNQTEISNIYIALKKDVPKETADLSFEPRNILKEEPPPLHISKIEEASDQSDVEEDNIYKYECLHCPTLFISQSDVTQHLQEEHPDEDNKLRIENNKQTKKGKTEKKRRSFHVNEKHMTKHPLPKINPDEVNKAKVEVNGKVFYKCKQCGKSLHSMYTYVWHTRIHTGERPFVCNLCHKQFRVSQGLVRHLKETHERIKNFDCDICGRYFATKRNVEEHRRIHTNERPYVCATCGKSFKQKASLFVHNRSHSTEFPYSCSDCSQKFRTKTSLLVHVTKHTGEKPFPCDVCGRHFRIKYELKRHKLIHSEDKPFTCKICAQSFRQKRYLRNHLKLNHSISNPNEFLEEYINAI